jgi:hypothetical protein
MNVQSSTRRRALLGIYRAHHKGRSGSLSVRQIEREWKHTGLRRADLELALRDMVQRQLLLPRRAHDGIRYELTYLGECATQLVLAGGPLATVRDWLTLRRAKLRQPIAAMMPDKSPRIRRAGDRPEARRSDGPDHAGSALPPATL